MTVTIFLSAALAGGAFVGAVWRFVGIVGSVVGRSRH